MRLGLLSVLLVVACTGGSPPGRADPLAVPASTGRFRMTLTVDAPDLHLTLAGSGAFDAVKGDVTYSLDLSAVDHSGVLDVRRVGGALYVHAPAFSDRWVKGGSAALDPNAVLDAVERATSETVHFGDASATLTVAVYDVNTPVVLAAPPDEQVVDVSDMLAGDERTSH